jgi:glycosyltransferase involved in cell wall biosynthesis
MKISVVMPTFHRSELLIHALRSVQAQDYKDWEVIVVDDGDGRGAKLANQLGDERIIGLHNVGRGQVDARNTALCFASGEAIALLDDDDYWEPFQLSQVAKALTPNAALCHSYGVMVIERAGHIIQRPFTLPATPESLRTDNSLLTSSLAYPRALHRELGLFDPSMGSYFDWDWILRVLAAGYPLRTIDTLGVYYRVHDQGTSADPFSCKRQEAFSRFSAKHQLTIVQKNHLLLFEEQAEARDVAAASVQ